jgi:hypothetical protein
MQRIAIGFGKYRNGRDAHPARGLDDPAGDLAAIGNQDALEHSSDKPLGPTSWTNIKSTPLAALRRYRANVNARSLH